MIKLKEIQLYAEIIGAELEYIELFNEADIKSVVLREKQQNEIQPEELAIGFQGKNFLYYWFKIGFLDFRNLNLDNIDLTSEKKIDIQCLVNQNPDVMLNFSNRYNMNTGKSTKGVMTGFNLELKMILEIEKYQDKNKKVA